MSNTNDILQRMSILGAKEFTGALHPNETNVQIDPFTIIMFASLIVSVIKMISKCREVQDGSIIPLNGRDINELASYELTPQHNRLLQRTIRRQVGWWNWLRHRKYYTDAVLKVGRVSRPENIDELILNPPNSVTF